MKKYLSIVLVLIYSIMSSNKHLKMNRFHNNELQQISLRVQYFNFPNFISNSKEENTNNFLLVMWVFNNKKIPKSTTYFYNSRNRIGSYLRGKWIYIQVPKMTKDPI